MENIAHLLRSFEIGPAVTHRNLAVFPLIGKGEEAAPAYRTLREGLAAGEARIREVSESGTVPQLLLENYSSKPILIMDGEELIGAKQNRCATVTVLAPAGQTLVIPVSCVEAGRWSYRGAHFDVSDHAQFAVGRAKKTAKVNARMRQAGVRDADQEEVWAEIAAKSTRMSVASPTAAMADIYDQHRGGLDDYVSAFTAIARQIGAIFAIGNSIAGLDLFDSTATFRAMLGKLVRSYAIDALEASVDEQERADAATARAFLAAVATARVESYPGVGLGTEIRLTGAGVVAGGLAYDDRCIHLAAFGLPADETTRPVNDDLFVVAATRRRRMLDR